MKSVFFCYPNVHQLATSYNGTITVRQGGRERERGREATWKETELHLSFWLCSSQSSKLSSLESSICFCGLLSLIVCPTFLFSFFFFFWYKVGLYNFLNTILQKRLSVSYLQEHQLRLSSVKSCFQLAYTCWCMSTEIQILL